MNTNQYTYSDQDVLQVAYPSLYPEVWANKEMPSLEVQKEMRQHIKAKEAELLEQSRYDLAEEFGVSGHNKEQELWRLAWEYGHSAGLTEVVLYYEELSVLLR